MSTCTYCNATFTKALSQHLRECPKYIFTIHQHPLTKEGPTTEIVRDAEDKIICRCVDPAGNVCAGKFKTQKGLWAHLNKNPNYTWLVCVLSLGDLVYINLCVRFRLLSLALFRVQVWDR